MKTWLKCLICISLSLMSLFTCMGYAKVSDIITVTGTVQSEMAEGIYITEIVDISDPTGSNVDKNTFSFISASTIIESTISRGTASSKGVVKYEVTVFNNTSFTYYYRDIDFQTNLEGYNGNDYISDYSPYTSIGVKCEFQDDSIVEKTVDPGEKVVFTVTYTIGEGLNNALDWKTLINIRFGINVGVEEEAIDVVEARFLRILNTSTSYEQLIDALDNKYDGYNTWTSNYIGNVVGSFGEDSLAVNTLFAGHLQIMVDGQPRDATVLIKHENVDWIMDTGDNYVAVNPDNGGRVEGTGCEMTLYLTIDPLTASGAYVPVYAVVFTCDRDEVTGEKLSDWYKVGTRYAGEANVVTYDGNYGTGSFVTDNWRATAETYKVIEGYSFNIKGKKYSLPAYSYTVPDDATLNYILNMEDAAAITTLQTLLNDAKRIMDDKNYAGEGIDRIREAYDRYSDLYTVDWTGNHVVNNYWPSNTLGKLSPAITELYSAINSALTTMSELPQ